MCDSRRSACVLESCRARFCRASRAEFSGNQRGSLGVSDVGLRRRDRQGRRSWFRQTATPHAESALGAAFGGLDYPGVDLWTRMTLAVPDSSEDSRDPDSGGSAAERRLIERARRNSQSALRVLFARYGSWLRKWARGRLPRLARSALDTSDLVQDALHHTFARLKWFKPNHGGSLRAYLRRSIENRIRDQLRRAACRRDYTLPEERVRTSDEGAPQFRQLMDDETWAHYVTGLKRLTIRDRRLLVGRAGARLQLPATRLR